MRDLFRVEGDVFPHGTRVVAMEGVEALSRPYLFTIDIVMPGEKDFDFGAALGKPMALAMLDDNDKVRNRIHGIVAAAELLHEVRSHALYRIELGPGMWLLSSLGLHSRVFVGLSVPQIVEKLLQDDLWRISADYEMRLQKRYAPRDQVCQYRESNPTFISRLCEREGIYFFFEQHDDGEKLVFTDDKSQHKKLDDEPIPYAGEDARKPEAFYTFRCRHASLPKKVRLDDHDYTRPNLGLDADAEVPNGDSGEVVLYGENCQSSDGASRQARLRAEELAAQKEIYVGEGHVFEVRPGYTFKLEDHPRNSYIKDYLTVSVRHHGVQGDLSGLFPDAEPRTAGYRVEVTAIPASTQFRPARTTPIPRIYGVERGVIDGPADHDYAQLDSQGLYLVRFRFDENDSPDGKASMRVRMLQPHGGQPEGVHFPLRKGTEVLLTFLGGDPDRPVIVGAMTDAFKPSPVTDFNHTQNVIHTGGGNRIQIEDLDGQQHIDISTPTQESALHLGAPHKQRMVNGPEHEHNFVLRTEGTGFIRTGGDHKVEVDGNRQEWIVKDAKVQIDGQHVEKIANGENRTIAAGGLDETITGGVKRNVHGKLTETLTGDVSRTVIGKLEETATGELSQVGTAGVFVKSDNRVDIHGKKGLGLHSENGDVQVFSPHGIHTRTPGERTEMDSKFDKLCKEACEKIESKTSIIGAQAELVLGTAMAMAATQVEATALKIEGIGVRICNKPKEFSFEEALTEIKKHQTAIMMASLIVLL